MIKCTRCQCRHGRGITCGYCKQGNYCSVRCQTIDAAHGERRHMCGLLPPPPPPLRIPLAAAVAVEPPNPQDPNENMLPYVFENTPVGQREVLRHQAPPRFNAFGIGAQPFAAAVYAAPLPFVIPAAMITPLVHIPITEAHLPTGSLRVVPRIYNATYLHLGEEEYSDAGVQGVSVFGTQRAVSVARDLGEALGRLHTIVHVDCADFSLVWGNELNGPPRAFLQFDTERTRQVYVDFPDTRQHLGLVLGLSPYVPRADQGRLFEIFFAAYESIVGSEFADEVREELNRFLT